MVALRCLLKRVDLAVVAVALYEVFPVSLMDLDAGGTAGSTTGSLPGKLPGGENILSALALGERRNSLTTHGEVLTHAFLYSGFFWFGRTNRHNETRPHFWGSASIPLGC